MNITLPDTFKEFLDERVQLGGYSTVSESICRLILADRKRIAKRLDELLLEGLNSGPPIRADEAFWAERMRVLEAES